MVLRNSVGQRDYITKKKRKHTAGATRLRLVRIGVGKAAIVVEAQPLDQFDIAQSRWRSKSNQTLLVSEALQKRGERTEILFAAEQAAVVREPMGSNLEAACL